ncbi:MAG: hypothetical protein WAU45_10730 [Blastocatellia bacterium]
MPDMIIPARDIAERFRASQGKEGEQLTSDLEAIAGWEGGLAPALRISDTPAGASHPSQAVTGLI